MFEEVSLKKLFALRRTLHSVSLSFKHETLTAGIADLDGDIEKLNTIVSQLMSQCRGLYCVYVVKTVVGNA